MIQLQQKTNSPRDIGQLTGHKRYKFAKGSLLYLFCILYVDNGTFTFVNRNQLKCGLRLVYSHFNKFGFEMYIERGGVSKTECVFFPSPGFFGHNTINVDIG